MTPSKKPPFQRVVTWVLWFLSGVFFLDLILNALLNANALVTPGVTYWGTAVIALCCAAFLIIVKFGSISWVSAGGQTARLLGPGWQLILGSLGVLALLWVPRILPISPSQVRQEIAPKAVISAGSPKAQEPFAEGLNYLKSYDLPKAKRRFCQAIQIDPMFLRARLYLARTWRDLGYDGAAAREAQWILDKANEMKADSGEVKLYEAFRAETRGHWKEAVDDYLSLWDKNGFHSLDALALVETLNLAGQKRLALETIDEIRTKSAKEKVKLSPLDQTRLEVERAIALMGSNSADQLAAAQTAEKMALKVEDEALRTRAQFVQCDALIRQGSDYRPLCDKALAGFQKQDNSADEAKVYQLFGHNIAALPQDQLLAYQKALDIYKTHGFLRGISDVRVNIATLLFDTDHTLEASQVCGAALETASQIGSLNLPAIRLDCTYVAKVLDHDFLGAKKESEEALALARQQGDRGLEASALQDMAYMAHALGLYPEASQSYREAMEIEDELHDESWEAQQIILLYARLLSDQGRHSEASKELQRALKPYPSMETRRQNVADSVCWDSLILGWGSTEWQQALEKTAGFTRKQCDGQVKEQGTPLGNLDSSLWAKVEVEEPHC
jgi:tetratricopeptide (TPR) repeat protein